MTPEELETLDVLARNHTATFIRVVHNEEAPDSRFRQELFAIDPRLDGHAFVVVSAADRPSPLGLQATDNAIFMLASILGRDTAIRGASDRQLETFIFPANEHGDIVGWHELRGSFQGDFDIDGALNRAGYRVIRRQEIV